MSILSRSVSEPDLCSFASGEWEWERGEEEEEERRAEVA